MGKTHHAKIRVDALDIAPWPLQKSILFLVRFMVFGPVFFSGDFNVRGWPLTLSGDDYFAVAAFSIRSTAISVVITSLAMNPKLMTAAL